MQLNEFFYKHRKVALAFSGGADSAYLLYAAKENGADVQPYYVKSQFQPKFEHENAIKLTAELGVALKVISIDILQLDEVTDNPPDRCYYCKRRIMGAIRAAAAAVRGQRRHGGGPGLLRISVRAFGRNGFECLRHDAHRRGYCPYAGVGFAGYADQICKLTDRTLKYYQFIHNSSIALLHRHRL